MRLLPAEVLKLARRPATYVVLAVLLVVIGLFYLGLGASAGQTGSLRAGLQLRLLLAYPNTYLVLVSFILSFGGLLAVAYGAAVSGAEWAWGTIRTVVARGESRERYVLVKALAAGLLIGLGVLVAFLAGMGLSLVAAALAGTSTDGAFDRATLATLPELLARTWLGVAEQAAVGFAVAMLFRSQLAGIGAGLAVYFGEAFLTLVPIVQDWLPYFPINVAQAVVGTAEGFNEVSAAEGAISRLDSTTAILLAAVYLVVSLAIAAIAARRAEITA